MQQTTQKSVDEMKSSLSIVCAGWRGISVNIHDCIHKILVAGALGNSSLLLASIHNSIPLENLHLQASNQQLIYQSP